MGGSGVVSGIARGLGDVATFGTNELLGNPIGKAASIATGQGLNSYTPQQISSAQNTPLAVLTQTGGAPLLAQIAMGVSVNDALAGYFGQSSGEFGTWVGSQDADTQKAIEGIQQQLTQVQSNTQLQNQTIQKLVNDFPNYMATAIPKYSSIMSDATKSMMDQAVGNAAAKYAAGGQVSSGAMNEASAKIGAQYAQSDIQYGTDLAGQDWMNQYTEANALRNFQQKMLGQGASQGFSAAQAALNRNQEVAMYNTGNVNDANKAVQAQQNQLFGVLGGIAGTGALYALKSGGSSGMAPGSPMNPSGYGAGGPQTFAGGFNSTPTGANANPSNYGLSGSGYR